MKSQTFLLLSLLQSAMFLQTSCSEDVLSPDDTNEPQERISFSASLDKSEGSRGSVVTTNNYLQKMASFKVWGYMSDGGSYYVGKSGAEGFVIDNKGDGTWDYDNIEDLLYWPTGSMNFYAITPATDDNYSFDGSKLTYTVPTDKSKQVDLMYATATNQTKTTNKGIVNLQFQHALSQVVFKGMTKSSNLSVEIESITIHNVNSVMTIGLKGTATTPTAKYANYGIGMSTTKTVLLLSPSA